MPGMDQTTDTTAVPFDPFELKDVVSGDIRDPYPRMHELRRQAPGPRGPIDLGEGASPSIRPVRPPITVLGLRRGGAGAARQRDFSSSVYEGDHGQGDGPHHPADGRAGAPQSSAPWLHRSFRSKVLERWEEDLVAVVVNELIDTFIDEGTPDLVRVVTFNFPAQVIARILGLPRGRLPAVPALGARADQRDGELGARHRRLGRAARLLRRRHGGATCCAGRRPHQRPGAGRGRGEALSDEEIFSFLRLLLPAGVETTYRATGSMLFALLEDRAQFDALYADRSLFPQAFEEACAGSRR